MLPESSASHHFQRIATSLFFRHLILNLELDWHHRGIREAILKLISQLEWASNPTEQDPTTLNQ